LKKNDKVALLGSGINQGGFSEIEELFKNRSIPYEILSHHNQINKSHSLAISLGYQRIIPKNQLDQLPLGLVVLHSSDLPQGRGWAPHFYTIYNKRKSLTLTMLYADEGVDSGDIIAKARYPIDELSTINELRKIDDALTLFLLEKFLGKITASKIKGKSQDLLEIEPTYHKKRVPEDSKVFEDMDPEKLRHFLRCLPPEHPGYTEKSGKKVYFPSNSERDFKVITQNITLEDLSS
jgi:methionyl-tRNA formyltransferase